MRKRLCIFDLDGTLVDSLRDIAESVNECLELLGLPPRAVVDYRYMVGEGVPTLCARAIGQSHPHLLPRLTELTRAVYRARPMRHSRPYPGVRELVDALRGASFALAVLSNKPHDMTVRMVRAFWPDEGTFFDVRGYTVEDQRKPNPHNALEICAAAGVGPGEAFMIGDTPTDVLTARAGGLRSVGVTWGFRTRADLEAHGPDHIVDAPGDVERLLLG